jgi:hypothetical protein
MIIQCRHCHHPNDADAAYCDGCGLRLPDEAERAYQQHQPPALAVGMRVRHIDGLIGEIRYFVDDDQAVWIKADYRNVMLCAAVAEVQPLDPRFDAAWKARRVAEEG